jgi:hypothetical protein
MGLLRVVVAVDSLADARRHQPGDRPQACLDVLALCVDLASLRHVIRATHRT